MPVSSGCRVEGAQHTACGNASRVFAPPANISYCNSNSSEYLMTFYSAMHTGKVAVRNTNLGKE